MTPSVSVIIPLYNKAPHIRETLESVFAQSVQPDEIIVVDDGSTDGSGDIVAGIDHPGLILIRQANQGVSVARNAGVNQARGDYVAFLDADDLWKPNHIEELVRLINDYPGAGLYSTMHLICMQGVFYVPRSPFGREFSGIVKDFCAAYADGLSLVWSSTACARREALISIGGFPVNVHHGEDVITWIKLAQRFDVAHSSRITAIYNRDAINRAANLPDKSVPASLVFLADLIRREGTNEQFRLGARLLFSQIAFYTSASKRESGEWEGLLSILKLAKKCGLWGLTFKIAVLVLIPSKLLGYARHWRHKGKTEGNTFEK